MVAGVIAFIDSPASARCMRTASLGQVKRRDSRGQGFAGQDDSQIGVGVMLDCIDL